MKDATTFSSRQTGPSCNRVGSMSHWVIAAAIALLIHGCAGRQMTFASPEEAARSLVGAVRSGDSAQMHQILGRAGDEIISSGDEVADRQGRETFLAAYDEKNELVTEADGSVTLQVGPDDWPMPIPIVKRWNSWRFDTKRGKEEILNRRIGRNELATIQVCLSFVDAQREYALLDPNGSGVGEYARKLISDPGKKNGLYWETAENEPPSPMGPMVAAASHEGYGGAKATPGQPRPFRGYRYRLLTSQGPHAAGGKKNYAVNGKLTGGFGVLAWPAEYGNSGIMTFMVNQDGIVYQRDLGRHTDRLAPSIAAFDPDPAWHVAQ